MAIPFGLSWASESWTSIILFAGLVIAVYELKQFEIRSKTALENGLNQEYREIIRDLPANAILDNEVDEWPKKESERTNISLIYPYIDISNQQIFLRKRGRITKSRWKDWEAGMETHFSTQEIREAWEDIKDETDGPKGRSFDELRRLDSPAEDFDTDPYYWDVPYWRLPFRKFMEILPIL